MGRGRRVRKEHFGVLGGTAEEYMALQRVVRSPKTAERVQYVMREFLEYCEQEGIQRVQQLTRPVLLKWVEHLKQTRSNPSTVWTHTSTVKAFLNWCVKEDLLDMNPIKPGDFPSKPKPYPKPLTIGEVEHLIKTADGKHWIQKRNVAILTVLLHCGCRRNELLQMKVGDVERGYSVVTQKGGRQHRMNLNEECILAIQSYLRAYRIQTARRPGPDDPLWMALGDKPLRPDGVRIFFSRLSEESGIHVWCHRMRATMATLHLARGASTETVRQALGHSSLNTIYAYSKLANEDLAKLLDQTSPVKMLKMFKKRQQ